MTTTINGSGDIVSLSSTSTANQAYLPAGTGAVATTVQSKLREVVSVKDFGAVGNKTLRLYFFNTLITAIPVFTAETTWQIEATMWSVSTSSQIWYVKAFVNGALSLATYKTSAILTTNAQAILLTGQLSNSGETLSLTAMSVSKF